MKYFILLFYDLNIILIIYLFSFSLEAFEYSPEEVFEYFNTQRLDKNEYEEIIKLISETLEDVYAFNEISKNPTQPSFYNTYFTPVNIQQRLKQIDITNITLYEFYQNVTTIFADLKDPLISINWNMTDLDQFFFFQPLDFYVKTKDGVPRIYGKCKINRSTMKFFKDGNKIYEKTLKLEDVPINNINGYDPFYFIENFGGNYMASKNFYSTFNTKIRKHNRLSLKYYPLNIENFKNFRVIYENGEYFIVDYIFLSQIQIYDDEKPIINPPHPFSNLEEHNNKYIDINDIEYNYIINNNIDLPWNFTFNNCFKCLVDEKNEVNIYYIHSIPSEGKNNYINIIINCYKLFDNNTYPIIVINDLNTNADIEIVQFLLNIISPLYSFNIYGTMKVNDNLEEATELNDYIKQFAEIKDCSSINYTYLISDKIEIEYSYNNKINLSKPFIIKKNKKILSEIIKAKKYMKNKRKPTEILILTDTSSNSAGSILIKYLQKSGAAIIARYMEFPFNNYNYPFDSCGSTSIPLSSKYINYFSKAHKKLYETYGFRFERLPSIQIFFDYKINNIPLEYEINPVNDKITISEILDKSNYDNFILESKNILEKYKTYCDSKNTKLLMISELCEGKFENEYTHGGFECKTNRAWSSKCVPSYCDEGYIFDHITQKCIEDLCLTNMEEEENEIEEEFEENKNKENEIEVEEKKETREEENEINEIEEKEIKEEEFEINEKEEKIMEEEIEEEKEKRKKEIEEKNEEIDEINNKNIMWTNLIIVIISTLILSSVWIIICFKSNYCCFKKKNYFKKNKISDQYLDINNTELFRSISD